MEWCLGPHVWQRCWWSAVRMQGFWAGLHTRGWASCSMTMGSQGSMSPYSWLAASLLMTCLARDWMSKSLRPAQIPVRGLRPLAADWQAHTAEEPVECTYHSATSGKYSLPLQAHLKSLFSFIYFLAGASGLEAPEQQGFI